MGALSKQVLSDLIGAIYDCALDPLQWERALTSIGRALDCQRALLSLNDLRRDRILINKSVGWTPYWLDKRGKHVTLIHTTLSDWLVQPSSLSEPFVASRDMTAEEIANDPYVEECFKPLAIADAAHFLLVSNPAHFSELVLFRQDRAGIFTPREVELGALLVPHLRRAVTISNVLDIRTIERSKMAEALDALKLGVVLTNAQGVVLHANRSAEAMLQNAGSIEANSGVLRARSPRADRELRMAIKLAAQDESGIGKTGAAIHLSEADAPQVIAHVLPMTGSDLRARLQPEAVAAVFIDRVADERGSAGAIATTFGLTLAEARIVESLLGGNTLLETTAALGIAQTAARTYLDRIFQKTGVSGQAELIRLAMRAAREPLTTAITGKSADAADRWPYSIEKFQALLADRKPREAIALLAGMLPRFDGSRLERAQLCILAAVALESKWNGEIRYTDHLRAFLAKLRLADWSLILANLPELLADLMADALEHDIESELCRSMIRHRKLVAPLRRPASWPWPIKLHVLGGFRVEREGTGLEFGAKPPTRSLDILRALATSRDQTCSLDALQDWFWPDLDGDQARAACWQAVHRLRKLLGSPELLIQREGKLRLAADKVWVDLADWEARIKRALASNAAIDSELEQLVLQFPGPLLLHERGAAWSLPAAERIRQDMIELTIRIGTQYEARKDAGKARTVYMRALDSYPDSVRIYKALIQGGMAQGDVAGAIEDYSRYERTLHVSGDNEPSTELRALIQPLFTRLPPKAGFDA